MNFEKMKNEILSCRECEERFGFEPVPIVHGKANSKILQISQAPSNNVHITRKPFNDNSGKKLKYQWYKFSDDIFYNKNNFYITALAHCFPGKNSNGGDRLPPLICAKKWLTKEIGLVNNELYVIIGGKAAKFFFPNTNYDEVIFKDNFINGKKAIVLPHPSPLNIKWFKDHPDFENKRLLEIQETIWLTLGINKSSLT